MTQCSSSICGLYPLDVSSTCCSGLSNVFLKDKSILSQEPPAYSCTGKPRLSHSWVSNTVLTSRLLQHPVPTRHFPDRAWSRQGRSFSLLLAAAAAPYAQSQGSSSAPRTNAAAIRAGGISTAERSEALLESQTQTLSSDRRCNRENFSFSTCFLPLQVSC